MLILSMLVYGVAFDFFNISGSLYVEKETSPEIRSSAQGVFMMMTNGFGAFFGSYAAGAVVDKWGWPTSWFIFAGFALAGWLTCGHPAPRVAHVPYGNNSQHYCSLRTSMDKVPHENIILFDRLLT